MFSGSLARHLPHAAHHTPLLISQFHFQNMSKFEVDLSKIQIGISMRMTVPFAPFISSMTIFFKPSTTPQRLQYSINSQFLRPSTTPQILRYIINSQHPKYYPSLKSSPLKNQSQKQDCRQRFNAKIIQQINIHTWINVQRNQSALFDLLDDNSLVDKFKGLGGIAHSQSRESEGKSQCADEEGGDDGESNCELHD